MYSARGDFFVFIKTFLPKNLPIQYKMFMRKPKKSKYRHAIINKKRYYFYSIRWLDITGDAGHATIEEFDKFGCAIMITQAYVYKKTNKFLWTFASYDEKEEVFSDRNVFPKGCIIKMEKINEK